MRHLAGQGGQAPAHPVPMSLAETVLRSLWPGFLVTEVSLAGRRQGVKDEGHSSLAFQMFVVAATGPEEHGADRAVGSTYTSLRPGLPCQLLSLSPSLCRPLCRPLLQCFSW